MSVHTYFLFGDVHVKPTGKELAYEKLRFPADVDAVLVNGDVTHRSDRESLAAGREFLAELASHDVPVVTVPGNHDPAPHIDQLLPPPVETAHLRGVEVNESADCDAAPVIVGWGCEQFDFTTEFDYETYRATDPRERDESRQRAVELMVDRLLTALRPFARGECTARDVLTTLEIRRERWGTALSQLARLRDDYDTVNGLLASHDRPTILLTHVPAFATTVDIHHSIGTREEDRDGLPCGSLALRLALEDQAPLAHLCGHSHQEGYHYLDGSDGGTHVYNPGFRGIARLDIDTENRSFSFESF